MTKKLLLGLTLSLFTFGLFEAEASRGGASYFRSSKSSFEAEDTDRLSESYTQRKDQILKLKKEQRDIQYQIDKYEIEKRNLKVGLSKVNGKDANKESIIKGNIGIIDEKIKNFQKQMDEKDQEIKKLESQIPNNSTTKNPKSKVSDSYFDDLKPHTPNSRDDYEKDNVTPDEEFQKHINAKSDTLKQLKSVASWTKKAEYYGALAEIEGHKAQYFEAIARKYEENEEVLGDLGKAIAQTFRALQKECQLRQQAYEKEAATYQKSINNAKKKSVPEGKERSAAVNAYQRNFRKTTSPTAA